MGEARKIVIIGAGFIGLEIAATVSSLGHAVALVEIARPMGRAVSEPLSEFFAAAHRAFGANLRLGVAVTAIAGRDRVEGVALSDGEVLAADLVVVGVGALAEECWPRGWARMRQRRRSGRRASDLGPGYFRDWRLRKLSQCGAWLPHSAEISAERSRPGAPGRGPARRQTLASL